MSPKQPYRLHVNPHMDQYHSSDDSTPRVSGTVIKWMPDKGYGFIQGGDGKEYFFHRSAVREVDHLRIGDAVTFVQSSAPKGLRAEDVEIE